MQNLQTLRRRIRSVQNTQKITRAMQMVAGAKLRRMHGELMSFKPYTQRLEQITTRFLAAHPTLVHPYVSAGNEWKETEAPVGLVVISSDTGLCGTYNERVFGVAKQFLMEHSSAMLVTIGKKGNRVLARRGIARAREILDWSGRYDPSKVISLLDWMEELYINGTVCTCSIAYTQFITALRWKPTVDLFLPVERPAPLARPEPMEPGRAASSSQGGPGPASPDLPEKVIAEPNREKVADECLRRYVKGRFTRILLEAFTSEHSARMIAMKNATDNAAEMMDHLTLVRNKARQAAITKELIEVVSGAEALR